MPVNRVSAITVKHKLLLVLWVQLKAVYSTFWCRKKNSNEDIANTLITHFATIGKNLADKAMPEENNSFQTYNKQQFIPKTN